MKSSKVPAILMALILAVSGCTGGRNSDYYNNDEDGEVFKLISSKGER